MFKLCPKISQNMYDLNYIEHEINDHVEVQLEGRNVNIKKLCNSVKANNIILHASSEYLDLSKICSKHGKEYRKIISKLMNNINKEAKNISVLFHCGWDNVADTTNSSIIEYLGELHEKSKIPILLENTIAIGEIDRANVIVNMLAKDEISLCIDTSHVRAMINRGVNYREYFSCICNCSHVHFSYSCKGDGYIDMKTHGVNHSNIKEVKDDLKILYELGIKDTTLCPEVMEDNNIYTARKNQIKEIDKIRKVITLL